MGEKPFYPRIAVAFTLLLMPLWFLYPLIGNDLWFTSDDLLRYPLLLRAFADVLRDDLIYPRWLPALNDGYGYPTFAFYQPGFFFFAAPFALISSDAVTACKIALFILFFVGALGAYRIARWHNDRALSLAFSALYLSGFYVWTDFAYRGDLSELMAMLLSSWPLYYFLCWRKSTWHRVCFLLSYSVVLYAHPMTALLLALCLGILTVAAPLPLKQRIMYSLQVALYGAIAALLAAPYWLTALLLTDQIHYDTMFEGYFQPIHHLKSLKDVFSQATPHFLLVFVGFYWARKDRIMRAGLVLYVAGLILMSDITRPLWEHIQLLHIFQFPWRIWSCLNIIQLFLMVQLGRTTQPVLRILPAVIVLLSLLHSATYPPLQPQTPEKLMAKMVEEDPYLTLTQKDEFSARTFRHPPLGDNGTKLSSAHGGFSNPLKELTSTELTITQPRTFALHQMHMKGWIFLVNDELLTLSSPLQTAELILDDYGAMQIRFLQAGTYKVKAAFTTSQLPTFIFWIGVVLTLFVSFYADKRWSDRLCMKSNNAVMPDKTITSRIIK